MLGALDESHIIRTIEYWDIEHHAAGPRPLELLEAARCRVVAHAETLVVRPQLEGKVLLRVELYDKTIGQFAHSGDKVAIDVAHP